ncbi:hypothetical protein G4Z16_15615 [Streptomyces bathyalis]|uniref:Serine/threonine protein kinase n=1 Tax=Streptomyces bathyalis TaxID=2710756 RepID=A0A7T1WR26_9ACTN|nr:hypothetical protein [Streptomyces bathyalis]QPP07583.1 hypothetical protein G4Z16_15615 [Streptomyces bathyalis]
MLQQQPRCLASASRFSLITLACTVVLAVALPIAAATAGPAAAPDDGPAVAAPAPSTSHGPVAGGGTAHGARSGESVEGEAADGKRVGGAAESCGPELSTPEGLSAQTCVMSEGGRKWARTYYRNATGLPLRAALTLTRPDGSALSADCAMPAGGRSDVCETPRERIRAGGRPYAAIAEAGSAGGDRMLLRSASNSLAR